MAQRLAAAPQLRSSPAPVYSYLVTAIGALEQRDAGTPRASLTFIGELAKKDGYKREHLVFVENSAKHPNLVEDVLQSMVAGVPTQMLIHFVRDMVEGPGGTQRLRAIAQVDSIASVQPDRRQLTLF